MPDHCVIKRQNRSGKGARAPATAGRSTTGPSGRGRDDEKVGKEPMIREGLRFPDGRWMARNCRIVNGTLDPEYEMRCGVEVYREKIHKSACRQKWRWLVFQDYLNL